jgi:hypothetical protein
LSSTDLVRAPSAPLMNRQARQARATIESARLPGQEAIAAFESVGQAAFTGLSMLNGLAAVEDQLVAAHPDSEGRARAIVDTYTQYVCTSLSMLHASR